jgi:hypothetical protein
MKAELEIVYMVVRRESSKPVAMFYERPDAQAYIDKSAGVRDATGQVQKPYILQTYIRKEDGRLLLDADE